MTGNDSVAAEEVSERSEERSEPHTDTKSHAGRPRIYVASLADYNEGRIYGRWLRVPEEVSELEREIREMLAAAPAPGAEEWAVHDHEGFFGIHIGEWPDLAKLCQAATFIAEHGELFAKLVDHLGGLGSLDEAERYMTEGCRGYFDSLAEFAEELFSDTTPELDALPQILLSAIDWEEVGRELELCGDIFTVMCGRHLHVFWQHI